MIDFTTEGICNFSYFFSSIENSNSLRVNYQEKSVIAFKIIEDQNKTDVYMRFPKNFLCYHYFKGKISDEFTSTENCHLTYHGIQKKQKQSGEIHIVENGKTLLKDQNNKLEAPLAISRILTKFPLPLCRFELITKMEPINIDNNIINVIDLNENGLFKNTIDVYFAKRGFLQQSMNSQSIAPEIFLSIFNYVSLDGLIINELIRRVSSFKPKIAVLQTRNFELILYNIQESRNMVYSVNKLKYFHTRDYFRNICNRKVISLSDNGWLVSKYSVNKDQEMDGQNLSEL